MVFFVIYFFIAMMTYGIAVPSGLFVPCLLAGAAIGRLYGKLLVDVFGIDMDIGSVALMGSSAFLGGVARMTM